MKTTRRFFNAILKVLGIFLLYQAILRFIRKRYHFPVPAFVGRFLDSDLRRAMQPAQPIIERSGIRPGMRVLEVGCGSGSYTTFIARAVGQDGEVCALDIQPQMLAQIDRKLNLPENSDIRNIRLYEGSAHELPFDDDTFDVVYFITVLQEIPEPGRALHEAHRVLKPGGKLAVTEFLFDPDYPLPFTTVRLGREAGFQVDDLLGSMWTYTARFEK
jgi:ubiquinone/menaquinone biosynthesis C-methylase UbiE